MGHIRALRGELLMVATIGEDFLVYPTVSDITQLATPLRTCTGSG